MLSNLAFFTITLAAQQILHPLIYPEVEYDYKVALCMIVLLLNIVVTFIVHLAAMNLGKLYLDLKLQLGIKNLLLDKIKEAIIIVCPNKNEILYANKTAKSYFSKWTLHMDDENDLSRIDLSKVNLEKVGISSLHLESTSYS